MNTQFSAIIALFFTTLLFGAAIGAYFGYDAGYERGKHTAPACDIANSSQE